MAETIELGSSITEQRNILSPTQLAMLRSPRIPKIGKSHHYHSMPHLTVPLTMDSRPNAVPYSITAASPHLNSVLNDHVFEDAESGEGDEMLISDNQMIALMLKAMVGAAVLATPYALRLGGWATLGMMVGSCLLCATTAKILIACFHHLPPGKGTHTYEDLVGAAFGPSARLFLSVIAFIELFGCATTFMVLVAETIVFSVQKGDQWGSFSARQSVILITTLLLAPLCFYSGRLLSYASVFGNFAQASLVVILVGVIVGKNLPSTECDEHQLGSWELFGTPLGLVMFSFGGHAAFPVFYQMMKRPENFNYCINVSFTLTAIILCVVAGLGYYAFGSCTQGTVTINLIEASRIPGSIASLLVCVSVMMSYPLYMVPSFQFTASILMTCRVELNAVRGLILRLVVISLSVFLAIIVPNFAFITAIMGTVTTTILSIIAPCALNLKFRWRELGLVGRAANVAVICCGLCFSVVGFIETLKEEA